MELEYFSVEEEEGKKSGSGAGSGGFDEESVVLPQKAQKSTWLDDRTP